MKPTNDFSLWLRRQTIPVEEKVAGYLLHIAFKTKDGRWFAMVKSRTIAEALDIDSNMEILAALAKINAVEGSTTFKNRIVPGFYLPIENTGEKEERIEGTKEPQESRNEGTEGTKEPRKEGIKEHGPSCDLGSDLGTKLVENLGSDLASPWRSPDYKPPEEMSAAEIEATYGGDPVAAAAA